MPESKHSFLWEVFPYSLMMMVLVKVIQMFVGGVCNGIMCNFLIEF